MSILAEVHIRAGEPRGLALASQAIEEVNTLHSVAVRRQRLIPLATALEARPGTDTQELARTAERSPRTESNGLLTEPCSTGLAEREHHNSRGPVR
ncbi:MAG: hypothetical protein ACRDRU_02035 [Pseudonocardiaceae bacterium]